MLGMEKLEQRLVLAPVIDTGDHYLLPDTPNQQIQILVSGGDLVQGLNFNSQIGDGGPELGGVIDGPHITDIDVENGTIFDDNNTGQFDPEPIGRTSVIHPFTISNTGVGDLLLTGDPIVQIIGPNASDFTVITQPNPIIPPGESTTFEIEFVPSDTGLRTATVVVPNNDPDEDPYNFAIQGTGVDDYPQWEGRIIITENGDVTADGLLATLTIDTTSFMSGTFDLILGDGNLNRPSDFAGISAQITNGSIILNSSPVGNPDSYTTDEDFLLQASASSGLLSNDSDPDGDSIETHKFSDPTNGAVVINLDGSFTYTPNKDFNGSDSFEYRVWDGNFYSTVTPVTITVNPITDILDRNIVYNDSYWDGNNPDIDIADVTAIVSDKVALFDGQTGSYANVSNYEHGINEILIIVDNLPNPQNIDIDDFTFLVGNVDDTSTWNIAPTPSQIVVQERFGDNGEDLIHIVWPHGSIQGEWLQTTMLSNVDTGLPTDDVFYFGSAPGDTGNSLTDFLVNATDIVEIRNNPHIFINPANIDAVWDINRDSFVNATDMIMARINSTTFLNDLDIITPLVSSSDTKQSEEVTIISEVPAGNDEQLVSDEQFLLSMYQSLDNAFHSNKLTAKLRANLQNVLNLMQYK